MHQTRPGDLDILAALRVEANHSRHGEVAVGDDDVVRRPHSHGALPAAPVQDGPSSSLGWETE